MEWPPGPISFEKGGAKKGGQKGGETPKKDKWEKVRRVITAAGEAATEARACEDGPSEAAEVAGDDIFPSRGHRPSPLSHGDTLLHTMFPSTGRDHTRTSTMTRLPKIWCYGCRKMHQGSTRTFTSP